jgi:hypothetical protein
MAKRRKGRQCCWWRSSERLEDSNMEDVMNSCAIRKLKPIGHRSNALKHLIRTCIAWTEFAASSRNQRLSRPMKQTKKHPITHSELQGTMVTVIVTLSISLSLKKTLPYIL